MKALSVPKRQCSRCPRRGLAPLELVLSLPLLLFVTALMINYGTAACWKVRSAMVARDAIWSSNIRWSSSYPWPGSGAAMPVPGPTNPVTWPVTPVGGTTADTGLPAAIVDPSINVPVARGPNLGQTTVVSTLLDPTRGMMEGTVAVQIRMPFFAAFAPIQYGVANPLPHHLLTDGWQIGTQQMQTPANPANTAPWMPSTTLYRYAEASQSLAQNYANAVMAIWSTPLQNQLTVLWNDPEFLAVRGNAPKFQPAIGWPNMNNGVYYGPSQNGFCGLDVNQVQQNVVQPLIYRIQGRKKPHVEGVPETMGRAFMGLYQSEIQTLKAQMQQPGADSNALQGQINQLQQVINTQLKPFVNGPAEQAAL